MVLVGDDGRARMVEVTRPEGKSARISGRLVIAGTARWEPGMSEFESPALATSTGFTVARQAGERLELPDGEGMLYRRAFAPADSARLFAVLQRETTWRRHVITLYGRAVASPRLSAWYGDPGAVYSYSGLRLEPVPWTPTLERLRERVEELAAARFNSVLLNLYRDGQDSMGWHSDDEPELGRNPVIALLASAPRVVFCFSTRSNGYGSNLLEDGDVLVLGGATQHYWRHQLPKTRQPVGSRINLTFRAIQSRQEPSSCSGESRSAILTSDPHTNKPGHG
ncbi:MAG: alpha-ketoglutarate-dependent dioxygenase AlkB [Chromatiales bacterium]|nr:alpha-ketoglutarate-dependent dioxygenase AlkB [Chromatiales bacterium]